MKRNQKFFFVLELFQKNRSCCGLRLCRYLDRRGRSTGNPYTFTGDAFNQPLGGGLP